MALTCQPACNMPWLVSRVSIFAFLFTAFGHKLGSESLLGMHLEGANRPSFRAQLQLLDRMWATVAQEFKGTSDLSTRIPCPYEQPAVEYRAPHGKTADLGFATQ